VTEAEAPDPVRDALVASSWPGIAPTVPLAAWREIDWRFALPPLDLRAVTFVGPARPREVEALQALGATVATADPDPDRGLDRRADGSKADVVIVTTRSPAALDVAGTTVRPGGWVLVRTSRSVRTRHRGLAVDWAPHGERRLRRSGYEDVTTWWHAPSRQTCSYIVSTGDRAGLRFVLRRWRGTRFGLAKSVAARALVALRLFPYAARDVTVAGRAPVGGRSAADPVAGSAVLVTPWFEASRHVIAITFRKGMPAYVAKVPRRPGDDSGIRREAASLRRLAVASPAAAARAPRVVTPPTAGSSVLVERLLSGTALGPERVRADPARAVRIGMGLVDIMPVTGASRGDAGWYDRLLGAPLDRFGRDAPAEVGADELVARTHERLRPLRDASDLPLVFEHGDLGHPNLVVRPSGCLGAVDWERGEPDGLPLHDLTIALAYVAAAERGATEARAQASAFADAVRDPRGWAAPALARAANRVDIDGRLVPPLMVAAWTRSVAWLVTALGLSASDPAAISWLMTNRAVALWQTSLAMAEAS